MAVVNFTSHQACCDCHQAIRPLIPSDDFVLSEVRPASVQGLAQRLGQGIRQSQELGFSLCKTGAGAETREAKGDVASRWRRRSLASQGPLSLAQDLCRGSWSRRSQELCSREPSPLAGQMAKHHIFRDTSGRQVMVQGSLIEGESFQWNFADRMVSTI
eukprot:s4924_g3.t1